MAGRGAMTPKSTIRILAMALSVTAPAFAYSPPAGDDIGDLRHDGAALDVTRHAMPPPDLSTKSVIITSQAAPPPTPGAASANPLWAIPLRTLEATRDRPLFTPTRRPPPPVIAGAPAVVAVAPPPPPPAEHPNLVLVGTVVGSTEGIAVFVDPNSHDTVRLRTGEGHNGWILQAIDGRAAILAKNDQKETLELPKPNTTQGAGPVVGTLPTLLPALPQASRSTRNASPRADGGCMPDSIGC
jgi:hypothetical protein